MTTCALPSSVLSFHVWGVSEGAPSCADAPRTAKTASTSASTSGAAARRNREDAMMRSRAVDTACDFARVRMTNLSRVETADFGCSICQSLALGQAYALFRRHGAPPRGARAPGASHRPVPPAACAHSRCAGFRSLVCLSWRRRTRRRPRCLSSRWPRAVPAQEATLESRGHSVLTLTRVSRPLLSVLLRVRTRAGRERLEPEPERRSRASSP